MSNRVSSTHRLLFVGFLFAFLLGSFGSVIAAGRPVKFIDQNVTLNVSLAVMAAPLNVSFANGQGLQLNVTLGSQSGPINVTVSNNGAALNTTIYNPGTGLGNLNVTATHTTTLMNVSIWGFNQTSPLNVTVVNSGLALNISHANSVNVSNGGAGNLNVSLAAVNLASTINTTIYNPVYVAPLGGFLNVTAYVQNPGTGVGALNVSLATVNLATPLNVTALVSNQQAGGAGAINVTLISAGAASSTTAGGTVGNPIFIAGNYSPVAGTFTMNISNYMNGVLNITNRNDILTANITTYMISTNGTVQNTTWTAVPGSRLHVSSISITNNLTGISPRGSTRAVITCAGGYKIWQQYLDIDPANFMQVFPIPLNCSPGQAMDFGFVNTTSTGVESTPWTANDVGGRAIYNVVGYVAP